MNTFLRVFLQTLFAWQRRPGRALGILGGQTGAVTFEQRYGGALNLDAYLHSIVPDGLFVAASRVDGSAGGVCALSRCLRPQPRTSRS